MALTHICCPHCEKEIRIELHVKRSESQGKGPLPVDLGQDVEDFIIKAIEVDQLSYRATAELLMEQHVATPRGGDTWYPASVQRQYRKVLKRRVQEAEDRVPLT